MAVEYGKEYKEIHDYLVRSGMSDTGTRTRMMRQIMETAESHAAYLALARGETVTPKATRTPEAIRTQAHMTGEDKEIQSWMTRNGITDPHVQSNILSKCNASPEAKRTYLNLARGKVVNDPANGAVVRQAPQAPRKRYIKGFGFVEA